MNRRTFVSMAMTAAATSIIPAWASNRSIKAVAFDGIALFDPRPVFGLAEKVFPGKGAAVVAAWRTRQFEYTWLRTLNGNYADFLTVTDEALQFAAEQEKLTVTLEQRKQFRDGFLNLKAWPDVAPALKILKEHGLGLAPLTDFTVPILEAGIKNSGLDGIFDHLLSTDLVQAYKPDRRSYQMGMDAFKLQRDEIAFVAFGGWDAAGAKSFGYPTFWANRAGLPIERLGVVPDSIAPTFETVPNFVGI